MEQKNMIIIIAAVAVVAVAAAAGVLLLNNNNGGSSSDYSYSIYAEVINDDGTVDSDKTKTVTFSIKTKDNAAFVEGANSAFESAGLNAAFTTTETGSIWIKYNGGGSNGSYYYDTTTKAWTVVSETSTQYVENSNLALMLNNGYISKSVYDALSVTNQAGYKHDSNMTGTAYAYMKLPDKEITKTGDYTYYVFYEIIGSDGKVETDEISTGSVKFTTAAKDNTSFATGICAAFSDYGVGTMTIADPENIFISFDGSTVVACFYYDSSTSAWTAISEVSTQYKDNTHIALMLKTGYISDEAYTLLSETEQAGYESTGMGGEWAYRKLPDKTSI